jgi:membrane protein
VSAAGGQWGALSPRRRRRLWSALIGGALLLAGFDRRSADAHPTDVPVPAPAKGRAGVQARAKARRAWLEILRLLYSAIGQHRVVSIAAGVAFFVLLAIFPAIAALVSVYGIFADPAAIRTNLNELSSLLPDGAIQIIGDELGRVASGGTSTLGATFLFTLGLSLWSANAGMKALFDALNIVYDAEERRGLIKLNTVSLAFTAGALLVLLLALGTIVVLPAVMNYLGLESIGGTIIMLARWPAPYMLVVLALAIIYRFGPDREHAQWH